ncbi:Gp138 family membrane-puncturing spike protein, partial [Pseudomonas aeruginosa]|nr:Gp138 family membrane-puncturing spike protein [Pseudomonas aeruginosa]
MNPLERMDDPIRWLAVAFNGLQSKLWTALPGIIQSFDAVAMTCTVQPAVQGLVRDEAGNQSPADLPLLLDCPVQFPAGGGCTLTFPVKPGDECLVVFASRCIDSWWQSGGIQAQAELRMHDLSDGFALLGFRSQPRVIGAVSTNSAQLRSDDG